MNSVAANHPKWKVVLWAADTVEPAMLRWALVSIFLLCASNTTIRVPVVVILFLLLWVVNLWIMEKLRMQYGYVLSIKSG